MHEKVCPKCQSPEIHVGAYRSAPGNVLQIAPFNTAELVSYVCGQCGFVEQYIAHSKKLQDIIEKWPLAKEPKHQP